MATKLRDKGSTAKEGKSFPLNDREEKFVQEYFLCLNATQAAIKAGYEPSRARITGSELLTKRNISARVSEIRKQQVETFHITRTEYLMMLLETYHKAMEPVSIVQSGKFVSKFTFDGATAVGALKLIGKAFGYLDNKSAPDPTQSEDAGIHVNIYAAPKLAAAREASFNKPLK